MEGKNFFGKLSVLVFMLIALTAAALAVPVEVQRVELNDVHMTPLTVNKLSLERNNDVNVEVKLLGLANADNLELQAFISGYEHNNVQRLAVWSGIFSVEKDEVEVQKFKLSLPEDLEKGEYRLRILVSDRNSDELVQSFNIKVDVPRHKLVVKDVLTYPKGTVKAGEALLVSVRVENVGEKDESDVKVTVSLPELGLSQTRYINEVEVEEQEQTEEFFLQVPKTVAAGNYKLKAEVVYNEGRSSAQAFVIDLTVLEAAKTVETTQTSSATATTSTVSVNVESENTEQQAQPTGSSKLRRGLEVVLLVLVALLVVVGLIIGFSKLKDEDEDEE